MAFEDRCSPNQANSPGPKMPATSPSPTDRPLKPYTCNTITPKHERPSSPVVAYNRTMSMVVPAPPAQAMFYHPYYSAVFARPLDYALQPAPYPTYEFLQQHPLPTPARPQEAPQQRQGTSSQEDRANLNFSISNILRPEFGSSAINGKKTTRTNKKEGPKSGGPTQSLLYKPYEPSKGGVDLKMAPLGKLSHAVASLPQLVNRPNDVLRPAPSRAEEPIRRPDSANSTISTASSSVSSQGMTANQASDDGSSKGAGSSSAASDKAGTTSQWPAWVFCTRYSDRPSSGPRSRRTKKKEPPTAEDKRPRTAFSGSQLARLKQEFIENRYLTEKRRQQLSSELGLNEAQIKIWFQNKRAKIKKSSGQKNPLALQLMAQGLYNHTTASGSEDEEDEIKVT